MRKPIDIYEGITLSEFSFKLIPTVSGYLPEAPARADAFEQFTKMVAGARAVQAEVYDHIEFVSAMSNFETVSCPTCGALLEQIWWVAAVDRAYYNNQFTDLHVTVPCCGGNASLNDLEYRFPQGFARFILTALEPPMSNLDAGQVHVLEAILGCTLRRIWVHI
jgi:hypothetical protein